MSMTRFERWEFAETTFKPAVEVVKRMAERVNFLHSVVSRESGCRPEIADAAFALNDRFRLDIYESLILKEKQIYRAYILDLATLLGPEQLTDSLVTLTAIEKICNPEGPKK